jgi:DeoR/GlpR family transcriptional regulator of sugar metabolism
LTDFDSFDSEQINIDKKNKITDKLSEVRRAKIFEFIKERGSVHVNELSQLLDISISTARRDLAELESQGSTIRIRGGATLAPSVRTSFEPAHHVASQVAVLEKQKIGKKAAQLLKNNQSVIFDSSSTVRHAVNTALLKGLSFRAVTNDIEIAAMVSKATNVDLCVLGGTLRSRSLSLTGSPGIEFLNRLHVDICLIGIHAVWMSGNGPDTGGIGSLAETSMNIVNMKQAMVKAAAKTVLLADSGKFGKAAFCEVCPIERIDIVITDAGIDPDIRKKMEQADIEVMIAE